MRTTEERSLVLRERITKDSALDWGWGRLPWGNAEIRRRWHQPWEGEPWALQMAGAAWAKALWRRDSAVIRAEGRLVGNWEWLILHSYQTELFSWSLDKLRRVYVRFVSMWVSRRWRHVHASCSGREEWAGGKEWQHCWWAYPQLVGYCSCPGKSRQRLAWGWHVPSNPLIATNKALLFLLLASRHQFTRPAELHQLPWGGFLGSCTHWFLFSKSQEGSRIGGFTTSAGDSYMQLHFPIFSTDLLGKMVLKPGLSTRC